MGGIPHRIGVVRRFYALVHVAYEVLQYCARQLGPKWKRSPPIGVVLLPIGHSGFSGHPNARKAADFVLQHKIGCSCISKPALVRCRGPPRLSFPKNQTKWRAV